MSKAVASTIPIGPCRIYWNDILMGSPKGQASIRYNKESVQAGLDDSGINVISHKTKESCEVDVVLADFKIHQLRYVYDAATEFAETPAIGTLQYDESTSTIMRHDENHELAGVANVTVDTAKFITSTINVFKSDWSNTPDGYTRATDFTCDSTAGTVARIAGGDISDGDTVHIEYNSTTTVSLLGVGGELADFEANLKIVHQLDNGKMLQFYAYRAKKMGASDIAISMADAFGGIPMTFHCLGDMTEPQGKQLFKWSLEA